MSLGRIDSVQLQSAIRHLPTLLNTARLVLTIAVLVFHLVIENIPDSRGLPNIHTPSLYIWVSVNFTLIFLLTFFPSLNRQNLNIFPSPIGMMDILMMAALMHITGGIRFGFGILVPPFVATACLINSGRNGMAYASFASILILGSTIFYENFAPEMILIRPSSDIHIFLQAALLCITCFGMALMSKFGSTSLRHSFESMQHSEEEIQRLQELNKLVLDHAQEGIIVTDEHAEVQLFNKKARSLLPNLADKQYAPALMPLVNLWNDHGRIRSFSETCPIGGQNVVVYVTPINRIKKPLLLMYLRTSAEITKEAQAAKLAALGQLTANLAHEIRNPLSAISHANELLQENNIDDVDEHLKQIIEHNVTRINRMMQDILSLNQRDRIRKKSLYLRSYLKDFLAEFMISNQKSVGCLKIRMTIQDCKIFVDEGHLRQILSNLMNNAWKFSRQDKDAIHISVGVAPDMDGYVQIGIADNGGGVAEDVRNHIFEPFFTTSGEGTGLGLYVARELAQANNGILRYNSDPHSFELLLRMETP